MEDAFHFRHGLVPAAARTPLPGALQSVADVLDAGCARDPDALALAGPDRRYTYGELTEASVRAAAALAELGVAPGDRVGACLPDGSEIVVAFLGAMRLSALWVGVPRDPDLAAMLRVLEDADVSVLLADRATHDRLQPHRRALRDLNQVVVADPGPSEWNLALDREDDPAPPEAVDPFAAAAIDYAGAGPPLGVVHSQHNLMLPGAVAVAEGGAPPARRPLTRLEGLVRGPLQAFLAGDTWVLEGAGDAASPDAGAPAYGRPEVPGAATRADPDAPPGSAGRALPHLELAILDDDERELPDGEVGEIAVRAARTGRFAGVWTPMLGYWNRPDATREALRGATLHTGDRGRLDPDGYLFVTARRAGPGG